VVTVVPAEGVGGETAGSLLGWVDGAPGPLENGTGWSTAMETWALRRPLMVCWCQVTARVVAGRDWEGTGACGLGRWPPRTSGSTGRTWPGWGPALASSCSVTG